MKKLKKLFNIITSTLTALAVLLAVLLAGVRLFGVQVFTVLSGSMEPCYHTGSIIYVIKKAPEEIKVGEAISFVLDESLTVATHRVIRADRENGCFYTKGDANAAADGAPVLYENVIGTPVFTIPYLGFAAEFIKTPAGKITAAGAAALLITLFIVSDILSLTEKKKKKKSGEKEKSAALQ